MPVSPWVYRLRMSKTCPYCGESASLREVVSGLPDGPLDEAKFVTGGCCISNSDPMTVCIHCGWEGDFINHLQTLGSTDLSGSVVAVRAVSHSVDVWYDAPSPRAPLPGPLTGAGQ